MNVNDEEEQKKISNTMDKLDSAVLTVLSTHANDDENNIHVEDDKRAAAAPTTTTTTGAATIMDNDNNDDNDENDSDGISTATMAAAGKQRLSLNIQFKHLMLHMQCNIGICTVNGMHVYSMKCVVDIKMDDPIKIQRNFGMRARWVSLTHVSSRTLLLLVLLFLLELLSLSLLFSLLT